MSDFYIDLYKKDFSDFTEPREVDHYLVTERVYNEIKGLLEFHNQFEGTADNGSG